MASVLSTNAEWTDGNESEIINQIVCITTIECSPK